ncbi:MAG: restriction endonuclease subunit S [Phycisphaerales bacterium]|nr:restriction endonuclease subunit S [Phycisphaeraceae bacterium]
MGCFAIRRGGLERIDPKWFIHGGHQALSGVTQASLGELVSEEPAYGAPYRAVEMQGDGVKYIRVTDFDDFGIVPGNEFVTAEFIEPRFMLTQDDLLFARSGATAGKSFLYDDSLGPSVFAGYCIRFRFDRSRVLPAFVYSVTKTERYAAWVRSMQRPSGQPNINKEEFKSFTLPLPDTTEQSRLVGLLETARKTRQRKLREADALFGGLDSFVLDQLGFALPPPESPRRVAWGARAAETGSERRLDPHRFAPRTRKLRAMVTSGRFRTRALAELVDEPISGDWGVADNERAKDREYVEALVVRATEFDDHENLILDNDRVRFRFVERESFDHRSLQPEDLVLEKSGGGPLQPVGRVAWIEPEHLAGRKLTFSNFVMRLRPNGAVMPVYLWAYLGLVNRCGLTESMQAQTHGIRNLKLDEYLTQPVPMPGPEVQQRIVAEVARCRTNARRLRDEAQRLWTLAKNDFEAALLSPTLEGEV